MATTIETASSKSAAETAAVTGLNNGDSKLVIYHDGTDIGFVIGSRPAGFGAASFTEGSVTDHLLETSVADSGKVTLSSTDGSRSVEILEAQLKTVLESVFVQIETGKGLSSNDYTNEDKQKLASIDMDSKEDNLGKPASGVGVLLSDDAGNRQWGLLPSNQGEQNVQADWNETDTSSDAYIKNKPEIPENISTIVNETINNHAVTTNIEEVEVETKFSAGEWAVVDDNLSVGVTSNNEQLRFVYRDTNQYPATVEISQQYTVHHKGRDYEVRTVDIVGPLEKVGVDFAYSGVGSFINAMEYDGNEKITGVVRVSKSPSDGLVKEYAFTGRRINDLADRTYRNSSKEFKLDFTINGQSLSSNETVNS